MSNQSEPNEAYFDRNQAVQAFALLAGAGGWPTGLRVDPDEPDWPVLVVELPTGDQVSWHLPKAEILYPWRAYTKPWDGHSVEERRARMAWIIGGEHYDPAQRDTRPPEHPR